MSKGLSLSESIKFFRNRRGLTLRELAQMANISPIYLSELENGKKKNPSEDVLYRIIAALDLTQKDMLNLLDSYSAETGKISPDIAQYIMDNKLVQLALRVAKTEGASQQDWLDFIINLQNKNKR